MMAAPSFAAALAAALAGCAAAATNSSSSGVPNYHGCLTAEARSFEYCDLNLTHEERSHSLISELSLVEKVGLISPDPSLGDTCFAHIHGIPRVDLPPYGWLVECNTGVASSCYAPGQCSTTFADQPASALASTAAAGRPRARCCPPRCGPSRTTTGTVPPAWVT